MENQTNTQNPLPYANLRVWPSGKAQKAAALALIEQGKLKAFNRDQALEWGISPLLYGLMIGILKKMPKEKQQKQLLVFLETLKVGANLSIIYFQFTHWMLVDETWGVRQWTAEGRRAYLAMTDVANLCARAINGNMPSEEEWANAAYAARAARAAAFSAAVADAADAAVADAAVRAYAAFAADAARAAVAAAAVADAAAYAAAYAAAVADADAAYAAYAAVAAAARADAARAKHEWAQAAAGKLQELLTEASAAA